MIVLFNAHFPLKTIITAAGAPFADSCGKCNDCNAEFKQARIRPLRSNITLIGVDLNPVNVKLVETALGLINNSSSYNMQKVNSVILLAGVSNTNTVISIDCGQDIGNEICMLKGARRRLQTNRRSLMEVPIMTIDKLLNTVLPKPMVEMLIIDIEGHDPLVLEGSRSLLKEGSIKIVTFEYHGIGKWKNLELKTVVNEMDTFGYECYFMGQNRLWRITGTCWHSLYEFHEWSNVLCIQRNEICRMRKLEKLVVTTDRLR